MSVCLLGIQEDVVGGDETLHEEIQEALQST
jgi:hypothetical protein